MARISMVYDTDIWKVECNHSSMDRSGFCPQRGVGSNTACYQYIYVFSSYKIIFGKTIITKFLVAKSTYFSCASNAGLLLFQPGVTSSRSVGFVTTLSKWCINQIFHYEILWGFYPDNIFLVDWYHETLGPGSMWGHILFLSELKFL